MNIYRVHVDTNGSKYREKSEHLVMAATASAAIKKAMRAARKDGAYKRYDAISLELLGDAI